jgi:hemerythrin-like metal-binding protein
MSEDIIFIDTEAAGPGGSWETFGELPRNWQTGCGTIDDEHRAIFEFINDGWRAAVEGDAVRVSSALALLASLHLRMWQHFAHEEAEMARFNYPALSEHAARHWTMLAGLNSVEARLCETGTVDREALRGVLAALVDDVLRADIPFKSFLYESGRITRQPAALGD